MIMTRDEAIRQLNSLGSDDQETAHILADNILLEVLAEYDFRDVAEAWIRANERIRFWYA